MRLFVTYGDTAARTMAEMLAGGKVLTTSTHRVPTHRWDGGAALGLDGPLREPEGDPPRWVPRRRAQANALRALAREATALVVATPADGPGELMGLQAVETAAEAKPGLARGARRAAPDAPERLAHLDPPLAEAEATLREIDAAWAAALAHLGPELGHRAPVALALAPAERAAGLAESGLVHPTTARRTAAGDLALEHLSQRAPALLDPSVPGRIAEWLGAVADGTLPRETAVARARGALPEGGLGPAPAGLEEARVLGLCPDCEGPMSLRLGGAGSRWLGCDCGYGVPLPRRGVVLAVPGACCQDCGSPLVRVDGGPRRCFDREQDRAR
jgi:hypothetical protein